MKNCEIKERSKEFLVIFLRHLEPRFAIRIATVFLRKFAMSNAEEFCKKKIRIFQELPSLFLDKKISHRAKYQQKDEKVLGQKFYQQVRRYEI